MEPQILSSTNAHRYIMFNIYINKCTSIITVYQCAFFGVLHKTCNFHVLWTLNAACIFLFVFLPQAVILSPPSKVITGHRIICNLHISKYQKSLGYLNWRSANNSTFNLRNTKQRKFSYFNITLRIPFSFWDSVRVHCAHLNHLFM